MDVLKMRPMLVVEGKPTRYSEARVTLETAGLTLWDNYVPRPALLTIIRPDGTEERGRYRQHQYSLRRSGRPMWAFSEPVEV